MIGLSSLKTPMVQSDQSRDQQPIKGQTLDAGTGEPVSRSDLVKGYHAAFAAR